MRGGHCNQSDRRSASRGEERRGGSETLAAEHRQRGAVLKRSPLREIRHAAKRVSVKRIGDKVFPGEIQEGGKGGWYSQSLNPGSTNRSGGTSRDNAGDTPAQVNYFSVIPPVEYVSYLHGFDALCRKPS